MDHIAELSELENELGQLLLTEQECAGVYYLVAQRDDEAIATEYYAVTDTPIISQEAREYGKSTPSFGCSPRRRMQAAGGSLTMSLEDTGFRITSIKRAASMKLRSTRPNSTRSILVHTQSPSLHREGTPLGTGF